MIYGSVIGSLGSSFLHTGSVARIPVRVHPEACGREEVAPLQILVSECLDVPVAQGNVRQPRLHRIPVSSATTLCAVSVPGPALSPIETPGFRKVRPDHAVADEEFRRGTVVKHALAHQQNDFGGTADCGEVTACADSLRMVDVYNQRVDLYLKITNIVSLLPLRSIGPPFGTEDYSSAGHSGSPVGPA